MQVYIELRHQQHWGYHIFYNDLNQLTVRVNRQPKILNISKLIIAIDAGHGGTNIGATGVSTDAQEKDYTLRIAKELEKALLAKKPK